MSAHAVFDREPAGLLHGGREEDVLALRYSQVEQMDLNQTALIL